MTAYFLRRLLLLVPTFLGITMLVFAITRFVPGGPVDLMIMKMQAGGDAVMGGSGGAASGTEIPEAVLEEYKAKYHFDKPVWHAYGLWLWDLLRLDLGRSFKFDIPVTQLIRMRLPISMYFGLIGFVLAYLVCVPLGIWKAIRHGTAFDFVSSAIVFVGYSIPGWALGALLLVTLGGGTGLDWFPLGEFRSAGWEEFTLWEKVKDQLHHTVLPVLAYAAVLMKNALMENLGQDYVRTAFAKGLGERRVIFVHATRNSLIPICTGLGHGLSVLMAGSYLIEKVFNIHGIGYLGFTSIVDRDYAVVLGILVFNTLLVLLGNILSDVLYVLTDPRIRFS